MTQKSVLTAAVTAALLLLGSASVVQGHERGQGRMMHRGQGFDPGPMGQGSGRHHYMGHDHMGYGHMGYGHRGYGHMGHGSMEPGAAHPPRMHHDRAMGPGDGRRGQGMMGPGGVGPGWIYGRPRVEPLDAEAVRSMLEERLAWHGNPRLKLGEVRETDDQTIVADIVTQDDSLVQRLAFDRYTGRWRQAE